MRHQSLKRQHEERIASKSFASWRSEQWHCLICHRRGDMAKRTLETHHIRGRESVKRHVEDNLAALCPRCHSQLHFGGKLDRNGERIPNLHPGHVLWAKLESEPETSLEVLDSIRKSKYEATELPEFYLKERERNQ